MALAEYRVWDRTQRIFHWINALAVLTLAGIGLVILNADALGIPDDPGMIALKTAHVYVGYVFAINLGWRLVWAFVGGRYARWSALLPLGKGFGRQLRAFMSALLAGRYPAHLGHSPLARIVLSAIVLLLSVQAATGLVLAGTDVYMPPLGGYFAEQVAADTHDPALVRPYAPDTVNAEAYAAVRAFRAPWSPCTSTHFSRSQRSSSSMCRLPSSRSSRAEASSRRCSRGARRLPSRLPPGASLWRP